MGGDQMVSTIRRPAGGQDPAAASTAGPRALATLVQTLSRNLESGRVPYWASWVDHAGVPHYAFVDDPGFGLLSPENAASRESAVAALAAAIERYRGRLRER
jgi:hypothetical protein